VATTESRDFCGKKATCLHQNTYRKGVESFFSVLILGIARNDANFLKNATKHPIFRKGYLFGKMVRIAIYDERFQSCDHVVSS
jgi:hypothetical protein